MFSNFKTIGEEDGFSLMNWLVFLMVDLRCIRLRNDKLMLVKIYFIVTVNGCSQLKEGRSFSRDLFPRTSHDIMVRIRAIPRGLSQKRSAQLSTQFIRDGTLRRLT